MAATARTVSTASCLVIVLAAASLLGAATAQSNNGCTAALVSLSPCLSYITGNETTASKSCCSQLKTVVQSEPQCLCAALGSDSASLGLKINKTRALGLPDECKVQTPPVSKCNNGGNAPSGAAPTTPSSGTPEGQTPGSSGAGSGSGSKATPSAYLGSGGASLRGSVGLVVGFVVVAVYTVSAV